METLGKQPWTMQIPVFGDMMLCNPATITHHVREINTTTFTAVPNLLTVI